MTLRAFVGPAHQKNYPSVRGQILHNSKMSELWLRLTADATVRATITADGEHVFAVYDSMAFFCGKSESYARTTWTRLISEKSTYKSELEGLVYTATFRSSINNRPFDTPAMTLRGLQRLMIILGGKVAADFRPPVHEAYRQALGQEPVTDTTNTKAYA